MGATLTVFMPVHNGEGTLAEAVESILGQSYADFEFLIIDDGSTDKTAALLRRYAGTDSRLRVLRNPRKRGLAYTFSCGFAAARGAYVARMDADDISEPRRLERQLGWLKKHPGTAVLGSWVRYFGAKSGLAALPWRHEEILAQAPFQNPLAHPTLMLDREHFPWPPRFERRYQPADDYGLWSHCLQRGVRFAALPEPLLRYRVHGAQAGARPEMQAAAARVRLDWLRFFKLRTTARERSLHLALASGAWDAVGEGAAEWLVKLRVAGESAGMPPREWGRWLGRVWLSLQAVRGGGHAHESGLEAWAREGSLTWRLGRVAWQAWYRTAGALT